MKKPLLMLAFSLLAAEPAAAQINLAWRNCLSVTTGPTSAQANTNYACDGNTTVLKAVVSFIAPPNITEFVGVEFDVQISTPSATLPDWWRHAVGECRELSYNAPGSFSGIGTGSTGVCQNPFIGSNTLAGFSYVSGSPTADKASSHHMEARDTDRPLTVGQEYLAQVITIDTYRDVEQGDGVCAGCQIPACLTVTQLQIYQLSPLPSYLLTNAAVRKSITWQGGTPGCAGATPARNHTWGAIKAIYR